jgi:AcrR family transcriptional regulator
VSAGDQRSARWRADGAVAVTASSEPTTRTGRRGAGTLTRDRIIASAIAVIDQDGIAALSMRGLGRELGASTMAVYRYFDNKGQLLDAVMDHVVGAFDPAGIEGDWIAKARGMSLRVRHAMLEHPELADLIGLEFRRSPTSLRVNAHMIEMLSAAGVPEAMLAQTYWAISSYTTGYALLEAQVRRRARVGTGEAALATRERKLAEMMRAVDGISGPALELAPRVLAQPLDDEQFLLGLECLLSGLAERQVAHVAAQSEA